MVNLQRRKGVYYFRLRVPKDLLKWFNRNEIKRSLKTCRLTIAQSILRIEAAKFENVALMMRSGMLSDSQIAQLAKQYIADTLEASDKERLLQGPQLIHDNASATVVDTATPYSMFAEEIQGALEGLPSPTLDHVVNHFLDSQNLTLDSTSLEYKKLRRELAMAHLEVLKIDERRDMGDFSDPYYRKSTQAPPQVKKPVAAPKAPPTGDRHLLSEAIKKYLSDKKGNKRTKKSTLEEYKGTCERFTWILGDQPIADITRDDARDFRDVLPKLPKHMNKKRRYDGKTLKEVLEMDHEATIGATQIKEYIRLFKSVFTWAFNEGWITVNPTLVIDAPAKKKKKAHEERDAFSREDLQRLIDGLASVEDQLQGKPERFWVPLIGLYSGARLNEICQLRASNISNDGGIWHFVIIESEGEDDKGSEKTSVKTDAGNREVPLHPTLIELGFLDYVAARKETKEDVLWANLTAGARGHAKNFSNWWNGHTRVDGFKKKYVTADKKKVFHSFRHTLRNEMKQAMVDKHVADEIFGHKHEDLGLDRYGKPYVLKLKLDALRKVTPPLNFDPIRDIAKRLR